jgi:alkylation response protein AidB-like acyl-CoA dehydrogenase
MPAYTAPRRDISFLLNEVFEVESRYKGLEGTEDFTADVIPAIVDEAAKFCETVLAPLNRVGDQEGCKFENGRVTTPPGFKQAYDQFVEGGWPSLAHRAEHGGQGLPNLLGIVVSEMVGAANWSFGMYPGLSHGAMKTIEAHGTPEQIDTYLPKLISGEWTGTMCLTEPHCGTDLGILRTKAEPNGDGSYSISGTKIFISAGEHDLTDNIVHIVLARTPGAPQGTKGISLFIVPKRLVSADGSCGEFNNVNCGSIEHKMGIHGNSTCVLNFEHAKGFMIGPENEGLRCMFTFMNTARIGTAIQGVATSEASFQGALAYAKERLAMRALSGAKFPDKPADPIIVHPDVRRMLLTQKAYAEGGRALIYLASYLTDVVERSQDEDARKKADEQLSVLTPICKAFLTEKGCEAANLGVQVFGGHGFIAEWGMEQLVRDSKISTLYEGTTGVQALDLLGRKVLLTQGAWLQTFTNEVLRFCEENEGDATVGELVKTLKRYTEGWLELTGKIGMKAMMDREEVGAAAVDYTFYAGYVALAYMWALMAKTAANKLAQGSGEAAFYEAKLHTARFYFTRLLPRAKAHAEVIDAGVEVLSALPAEHFAFL